MNAVDWADFEAGDGELAAFVQRRLTHGLCYLATIRPDGFPRCIQSGRTSGAAGSWCR